MATSSDFDLSLPSWDRGGRRPDLSPLYASIRHLIDANAGCVCLIQVGGFYELYYEQAVEYAPKLGLKVASKKTIAQVVPMLGFPMSQLQKYVKVLVQDLGETTAIIDQCRMSTRSHDGLVHRKISRIVTPGTLVDEPFLNYNTNNYLVAISFPPNCVKGAADPEMPVGLSWMDVGVGDFYVQNSTLADLMTDVSRISPSEIILHKDLQDTDVAAWFAPLGGLRRYFRRYHKTVYKDYKLAFKLSVQATRKRLESFSVREEAAMNMVLSYVNVNLPESNPVLDVPTQYWNSQCLQMDPRTREALELTERLLAGHTLVVGTLLLTIRRTVSPSGTRLLTQWLKSPILDVAQLTYRHQFVTMLQENPLVRVNVRQKLAIVGDFVRALQQLLFSTGNAVNQLRSISEGLLKVGEIHAYLSEAQRSLQVAELGHFLRLFEVPMAVAVEIDNVLQDHADDDEKTFAVRPEFSPTLLGHHKEYTQLKQQEHDILVLLRRRFPFDKLKIEKKEQHGRHTNVILFSGRRKDVAHVCQELDDIFEKRIILALYKPPLWAQIQSRLEELTDIIHLIERTVVADLRAKVLDVAGPIRTTGKKMDFLDVTALFAVLADECNLVRPTFVKKPQLRVIGGRHPVVEDSLKQSGQMFTTNDTKVGVDGQLWVILGPNMGGKSTFLRQNALIVIMAQIGCFVPATKASLGVVDKIFTRIGASDDLFSDLSTFMVEMVETSNILENATPNSLAIVDEVGRGTSGREGLAIAYATLLSLLQVNKCRTLFATHFGRELQQLLDAQDVDQKKLRFYRTKVLHSTEAELGLVIDHELEPGISDRSYALEVAEMAGFPGEALKKARQALRVI